AIYPGNMLHFKGMLEQIRPQNFDIEYRSANPFEFFGNESTELDLEEDGDLGWYL
ncbi:uncharacterized protein MYCFIDRAFT_9072, partial [Pseudocercospora fijiensis CIRAD86]